MEARRSNTDAPFSQSVAMRIPGGPFAPRTARSMLSSRIAPGVNGTILEDAALIVSELVTNSVRHANVGVQKLLAVDVTTLKDRLRITVSDPGSDCEPRLVPAGPEATHGFGLRLVDRLATAWGVTHEPVGTTQVWCEILLVA
jgi:anti-sigma regulatory factor (Ser/Thr protein kinase)